MRLSMLACLGDRSFVHSGTKILSHAGKATRKDATPEHREACQRKLDIYLLEQRGDLGSAITLFAGRYRCRQKVHESVQADENV